MTNCAIPQQGNNATTQNHEVKLCSFLELYRHLLLFLHHYYHLSTITSEQQTKMKRTFLPYCALPKINSFMNKHFKQIRIVINLLKHTKNYKEPIRIIYWSYTNYFLLRSCTTSKTLPRIRERWRVSAGGGVPEKENDYYKGARICPKIITTKPGFPAARLIFQEQRRSAQSVRVLSYRLPRV